MTLLVFLLNIFAYYWPELIKEHRIARIETPILIAKCGKNQRNSFIIKVSLMNGV